MNLIANISLNHCIGNGSKLANYNKLDMQRFRQLTINNVVIMGSTTYINDLKSRKLPDRTNIIITRNKGLTTTECNTYFISDINTAINLAKSYDKSIWIIGGSQIYDLFMPHITKLFITHTHNIVNGDKYLNLDWSKWNMINEVKHEELTFAEYDLCN